MSPQWLNFELGAFEFAYAEFTFDYGVKGGVAAGLPTSWDGGQSWDAGSEDAPGGWADGLLEGVHDGIVLDTLMINMLFGISKQCCTLIF